LLSALWLRFVLECIFSNFFRIGSVTLISYFILLKCLMKNICCLIFHLKLPFPLSKNRQFVFPSITYCFRVKILKSIWSSNFQSIKRVLILSNLSPINLIRSFWKQSFNLNSILARCTTWMHRPTHPSKPQCTLILYLN
jgi:hypothetical protein